VVIKQEFLVPTDDGHVGPAIGGEHLHPVLLLLPNFEGKLGPMVGIVGKETEWVTYATNKVSFGQDTWKQRPCVPLHSSCGHRSRRWEVENENGGHPLFFPLLFEEERFATRYIPPRKRSTIGIQNPRFGDSESSAIYISNP